MIRAQDSNRQSGSARSPLDRHLPRRRLYRYLLIPAVQVLLLASTVACSAPSIAGGGIPAPPAPAATGARAAPALGATPGAEPTMDPATQEAKVRLEAAVTSAVAGGTKPGTEQTATGQAATEQIRAAVVAAGFPPGGVEITAGRTPTGLAADAVEIAVRAGRSCIVAQLRDRSVAASVLPALAGGGCLIGSVGTR